MNDRKKGRRSTLADALDATSWDFKPGADGKILLRPAGAVFGNLPWEVRPQYLGPAPLPETKPEPAPESENDTDDGAETRPIEPLKK